MKHMKPIIGLVLGGMVALLASGAYAETNLCPNASFTSAKDPLEGWGVNYDWTGNEKQIGNQKNISVLPEFKGRKNVLKVIVPKNYESKFETPLMAYEPGARYQCTFDLCADAVWIKMLFLGYKWRPGIAPNDEPKLQDMRRVFKGNIVEVNNQLAGTTVEVRSWKKFSVTFPHEEVSELAYKNLKQIRYVTVFMYTPGGGYGFEGNFYVSNLKVVKLPGKCKVMKGSLKASGIEN